MLLLEKSISFLNVDKLNLYLIESRERRPLEIVSTTITGTQLQETRQMQSFRGAKNHLHFFEQSG